VLPQLNATGEGRVFIQLWSCPQVFFVFFDSPLFVPEESNALRPSTLEMNYLVFLT
jgi:hypothetical protein